MLTRHAKSYSSCSQTVSLFPAISSQFILGVCTAAEERKKSIKARILEVQGLSKSSMLIWLKSSSLMLVVIGIMPVVICNRFHERLANNGKITTFTGVPLFNALVRRFPWSWKIETWNIKIYVQYWKFHMQLLHVYLNWFWCNLLLKCVSQPKIAKKSIKTPCFGIQGHLRTLNLVVIESQCTTLY